MKRTTINYVAVGLVTLAALLLLAAVLYRITGQGLGGDDYHAFYSEVSGIKAGTPIYFEGYRIGQVEEVIPQHEGSQTRFRVEMSVESGWPIPADSVANIASAGLLSDVFVLIRSGEATQALEPGSEIAGAENADLFAAVNTLAADMSMLVDEQIRPLLELLNMRIDGLSGPIVESIPGVVSAVDQLLGSLNRSSSSLEDLLGDDNRAAVSASLADIRDTSASLSALARDLRHSQDELHQALARFNAVVQSNAPGVDHVVIQLRETMSALSARLDAIAFNLEESSRNFNEFSRSIRREPNRLIFSPEADKVENE